MSHFSIWFVWHYKVCIHTATKPPTHTSTQNRNLIFCMYRISKKLISVSASTVNCLREKKTFFAKIKTFRNCSWKYCRANSTTCVMSTIYTSRLFPQSFSALLHRHPSYAYILYVHATTLPILYCTYCTRTYTSTIQRSLHCTKGNRYSAI